MIIVVLLKKGVFILSLFGLYGISYFGSLESHPVVFTAGEQGKDFRNTAKATRIQFLDILDSGSPTPPREIYTYQLMGNMENQKNVTT